MHRSAAAIALVSLVSAATTAAARAEGTRALGFNCWVADGPSLIDCQPLPNELPEPTVAALRARLEGTPACQLEGLEPGDRIQRTVEFRQGQDLTSQEALNAPYERPAGWRAVPDPQLMARYYPERAAREEVEGQAIVTCDIDAEGLAEDCAVTLEKPESYGFGDAALKLARDLRLAPRKTGCAASGARAVRLPLSFRLPLAPADPVLPSSPPPVEPEPNRAAWADILFILLGLATAAVSAAALRPEQAGRPTRVVETPHETLRWGAMLGIAGGIGAALWPAWLLWRAYGPQGDVIRATPGPLLFAPEVLLGPLLALLVALAVVNVCLRYDDHEREAHWIRDSWSRGALFEWVFFGLGWIFSGAHRRLGGRFLAGAVAVACILALATAGVAIVALVLAAIG